MRTLETTAWVIALAVPHVHVVAAQANPPGNPPAVPTIAQLTYTSAFDDYRPYQDVPVADWRRVNDTVRNAAAKGGGHASHGSQDSKGSQDSTPGEQAAPPPAAAPQHPGEAMPEGPRMDGGQRLQGGQGMHGHRGRRGGHE